MKTPILYCDDGSEVELPYKWCICGRCDGEGRSSAYLGAFTRDDLDDMGDEWCDDYFAGRFDRSCEDCGGAGKVKEADTSKMTPEQVAAWNKQVEDDIAIESENRMERLMEGGWREEGWY